MATPNPPTIEKQLVDLDLSGGVDESMPEETIDWTKRFTQVNNLVINGAGLAVRPGARVLTPTTDSAGTTVPTVYRLGATQEGLVAFAGSSTLKGQTLFQVEEGLTTHALTPKGSVPDFTVASRNVSSCTSGYGTLTGCMGVVNFTSYQALLHTTPLTGANTSSPVKLIVVDRSSGNIVRSYIIGDTSSTSLAVTMVGVDDRYLHIYQTRANFLPKMGVIDTQALPALFSSVSFTNLTTAGITTDRIAGVVPVTNGSVSVTDGTTVSGGVTYYIQKFNNSGASVSSSSGTGFYVRGIDWNGTSFCLVGSDGAGGGASVAVYKELNTSYAVTRTVTGPVMVAQEGDIRVAASSTVPGEARIIAYGAGVDSLSVSYPCPMVFGIEAGGSAFVCLGYLPNWQEASLPVFNATTGRYYVHMHNIMRGSTDDYISNCDAVICISNNTSDSDGDAVGDTYPRQFKPEAVLDAYTAASGHPATIAAWNPSGAGFCTTSSTHSKCPPYRPHVTTTDMGFAHWSRTNATITSPLVFSIDVLKEARLSPEKMSLSGGAISGGTLTAYDGFMAQEHGFLSAPTIAVTAGGGGGPAAGTYGFVAVFSYTDFAGNVHRSRTSRPRTVITGAADTFTIQVVVPTVSMRGIQKVQCSLFRTATTGTQYYLVEQKEITTTAGSSTSPDNEVYLSFTDASLDATLITNPLLYRQPGTTGTALDRYHGLSANCVIRHKDRVFYAKDSNVYYSSFAVDFEANWFNPAFVFAVPGGTGEITGLGSMDGVLVVFKRDGVWVVDGEGPPENGGNGTEFSTPRRLHTEFGCVDARTIVSVPDGLMYRSLRGIELLSRNSAVTWVGERVQRTVDANQTNYGGTFDKAYGRVLFSLGTASTSTMAVYDIATKGWYTATYGAANPIRDVCFAYSVNDSGTKSYYVFMANSNRVLFEDWTSSLDKHANGSFADEFVATSLFTGWVHGQSKQDRIRVTDLLVLGLRSSNHNLKCQFYSDYNRSTTTTIKTFTGSDTTVVPEQMEFQPSKESVQSMKFGLTTVTPTVSTALTTGKQLDIHGLTVRLGIKTGGAKLPAAQKG